MADHRPIAPLVKLTPSTAASRSLAGDAAQLSSIGPGGLFTALEGNVPTAELTEVHRANHEWERKAWEQIRAGEPGPALAQYQAHDRLHIHDTRAEAAEAMVENWDRDPQGLPGRAGGDDHRRLQHGARPDERDGPGTPRRSGRAGSPAGRATRQALRPARRRRGHLHRQVPRPRRGAHRERHHRHRHRRQPRRAQGHDQHQRTRAQRGRGRHQRVLRPLPRLRRPRQQGPGHHRRDPAAS